jgi:hypothetical protein
MPKKFEPYVPVISRFCGSSRYINKPPETSPYVPPEACAKVSLELSQDVSPEIPIRGESVFCNCISFMYIERAAVNMKYF